jgi:ABC-type transport system involved in multi-copper enzyme maturation permease subunit
VLADFWRDIVILIGMGIVLFAICTLRFRKKIG